MQIKRAGSKLSVYFEGTEPLLADWLQNFKFWKKPYRDMDVLWFVHAGFLEEWKKEKDAFAAAITDDVDFVEICGLSQGGAVATLAHEYVWFAHPRLRDSLRTLTFGSPRVVGFWNFKKIKDRFKNLVRVVNRGDYVTNVPPVLFGYHHVGDLVLQGTFTPDIRIAHGDYSIPF